MFVKCVVYNYNSVSLGRVKQWFLPFPHPAHHPRPLLYHLLPSRLAKSTTLACSYSTNSFLISTSSYNPAVPSLHGCPSTVSSYKFISTSPFLSQSHYNCPSHGPSFPPATLILPLVNRLPTNLELQPSVFCYQARASHTLASIPTSCPTIKLSCKMSTLSDLKAKHTVPEDLVTKYTTDVVHRYMMDCMTAVGTPEPHARALADVLLAADTRGHFSHGLNRLEMYVNDVRAGICAGSAVPTITKESVSTGLVHGNNALGPVVGNFCVDMAIKKAKDTGIGWVCARGSNHYGIAGWYAMRATKEGLLGMSFTNTSPLVAPTRAKKPALGTNPLALSAPTKNGDDFVLDMATCVVAVGKIEVERRKEKPIPEGWAIDKNGQPTTNAAEGMSGALMPLGGTELHSGYKGYGLGMLVEIFCGIMSGGQYGPNVRRWMQTDREADLGQCFVAIDPSFFAEGFEDRMGDLMGHCRNMDPADPDKPVLAAGDPERAHLDKVKKEGGINYHINQIKDSWRLAKALGVKPMQ